MAFSENKYGALAAIMLAGLTGTTTLADPIDPPGITIELSATEVVEDACRLSFVVQNPHAQDITALVFETVLFNTAGQVDRLTLLDFQDLPAGRLRVRQFQFAGLSCADISRVLINGSDKCEGKGLPDQACDQGLTLRSLTGVELVG